MTINQIIRRIAQLSELAAQCVARNARQSAAEFYNLILRYQFRLMAT